MHIENNSTSNNPHLKLEENGDDYARLELTNDAVNEAYWLVAGLPSDSTSDARLNFYFSNASGSADRMTITGDGEVGVNGIPTARLELFQRGQSVGKGLRFDDGINSDWDVTHGFGLRFHYGGTLRGLISATTGAYIQGSDARLKTNISAISSVMDKVKKLKVSSYNYKSNNVQEPTIGFLAQEVLPLFPELVSYSEVDDVYGINYGGFSVIAIKAAQEQQIEIDAHKQKIKNLETRIEELETLMISNAKKD